ncbi:hypothetical protein QB714_003649 [Salmonella enterica]|nr:hypothetical protein [Salmonella enterica]EKS4717790.1 hypothetical protein [Salmonella enterica]EKS4722563.1 hypothetical protein [Salmonella enterica]EKS4735839.1 hypothetical protein [Salmonella enterica]EKS4772935.1 hypothetical protein [Salmonella enterica]
MAYNNPLDVIGLLGRNVYSESMKKAFPEILIDDLFVPYDGDHLAIINLKQSLGIILYFDCTHYTPPIYLKKIDSGIVLSAVQFLKPIEKEESPEGIRWTLPYNLTFSDTKEIVIKKIGKSPGNTKSDNSVLILEWQEDIYVIHIAFDLTHQMIQKITYLGKFIESKS